MGSQFLDWHTPLAAVQQALGSDNIPDPYAHMNWPACHVAATKLPGLQASTMIRGPRWDRPGIQYNVDLPPLAPGIPQADDFRELLAAHLGIPVKQNQYESDYPSEYSVAASLDWVLGPLDISLSVYGGIREQPTGVTAAGLYVNYTDVAMLAQPFRDERARAHLQLDAWTSQARIVQQVRLHGPVRHMLDDAPDDPARRAAYLTVYKPEVLDTPLLLGAALDPHSLCLWHDAASGHWGISNKWDTVAFAVGQVVAADAYRALPARGSGNNSLRVAGLYHEEPFDSDALQQITAAAAQFLPAPIVWQETFDE